MTRPECAREFDVVRAVLAQQCKQGPEGSQTDDAELQMHARTCAVCAEVVTVTEALRDQRDEALRDVHVPAAGQVWWRAAVRAHVEAGHAARRPMIWLHGIAGACAAGVGAALVSLMWPSIREAGGRLLAYGSGVPLGAADVALLIEKFYLALVFGLAAVACLVLTPLVVYFALSDD